MNDPCITIGGKITPGREAGTINISAIYTRDRRAGMFWLWLFDLLDHHGDVDSTLQAMDSMPAICFYPYGLYDESEQFNM